jgi:hypothetical protein
MFLTADSPMYQAMSHLGAFPIVVRLSEPKTRLKADNDFGSSRRVTLACLINCFALKMIDFLDHASNCSIDRFGFTRRFTDDAFVVAR